MITSRGQRSRVIRILHGSPITEDIREGNRRAHDGDAVTDATLYQDGRVDNNFPKIYSLSHTEILDLGKSHSSTLTFYYGHALTNAMDSFGNVHAINLANKYATFVSQELRHLSPEYRPKFAEYRQEQLKDLRAKPLALQNSRLWRTYYEFLNVHNAQQPLTPR